MYVNTVWSLCPRSQRSVDVFFPPHLSVVVIDILAIIVNVVVINVRITDEHGEITVEIRNRPRYTTQLNNRTTSIVNVSADTYFKECLRENRAFIPLLNNKFLCT